MHRLALDAGERDDIGSVPAEAWRFILGTIPGSRVVVQIGRRGIVSHNM